MNKLMEFFCSNSDELFKIHEFDNRMSFKEFDQERISKKLVRKMKRYRDFDYERSPEDILIEQEEIKELMYAFLRLRKEVGTSSMKRLMLRYGLRMKVSDIAKHFGEYKMLTSRRLKKSLGIAQQVLNELIAQGVLDEDVLRPSIRSYEAKTPTIKVNYPFDSARQTFKRMYKYAGEQRPMTTCKAIEYLDESFGDNQTICNFCGNQCTRLKDMEKRI